MQTKIRYCADIGMYALDRPRSSCTHQTSFCKEFCYNKKFYYLYPNVQPRDLANEQYFQLLDGQRFKQDISKKVTRFRFCTRGEPLSIENDITKIHDIVTSNPDILFWVPTRAWRKPRLLDLILTQLQPLPNMRLQASIDPSNTPEEIQMLTKMGLSTMYFGDNSDIQDRILCQKTWYKKKGRCATCEEGCFQNIQTHVHMKKH